MTDPGDSAAWHAIEAADGLAILDTTPAGLSADEARARLERYGANRLPEPARRSALMRFLLQFHDVLIYVLLGSAAITAALDHPADTAVIIAVVIVNAIIGYLQEGKAEEAMHAIRLIWHRVHP